MENVSYSRSGERKDGVGWREGEEGGEGRGRTSWQRLSGFILLPTLGWCPGPGELASQEPGFLREEAATRSRGPGASRGEGRRLPSRISRMVPEAAVPCSADYHIVSEVIWSASGAEPCTF